MRHRLTLLLAGLTLLALPASVTAQDPSPMDWGASCAVPASPTPQATADCGPASPAVPVAVIDVSGEVYRIELSTPGALEGARALLAGTSAAAIPNGVVVYDDPGKNAPWSWHIDPATLEWAEMTTEVCDGRPTQLQDGVFTYERFCPWSAQLLAIDGDPDAPPPPPVGELTPLPLEASGGTSTEDRTFAQRVLLEGGAYVLRIDTGDNLDLTVSTCPAEIRLLFLDGTPAPGSSGTDSTVQPSDRVERAWPELDAGPYLLYLGLDCAWSATFEPAASSAS